MKVPRYIDDLLKRRLRAAQVYNKSTNELKVWLIKNRVEVPEGVFEDKLEDPVIKTERLRYAILDRKER